MNNYNTHIVKYFKKQRLSYREIQSVNSEKYFTPKIMQKTKQENQFHLFLFFEKALHEVKASDLPNCKKFRSVIPEKRSILIFQKILWDYFFHHILCMIFQERCFKSYKIRNIFLEKLYTKRFTSEFCTGICKNWKQSSRGVLKKMCSENMQKIYWRTPMPKCNFNKAAKQYSLKFSTVCFVCIPS